MSLRRCLPAFVGLSLWLSGAGARAQENEVRVDAATEKLIRGGLRYLAARQDKESGAWEGENFMEKRYAIAMTSYTLMAFLAAGQLPDEGEFGVQVSSGLRFLLGAIGDDGLIGNRDSGQYMYIHGISAIVLAEMYGQTRTATIRDKLEKMVKVIIAAQNSEGGWRYKPYASDADISVTVLQVVALRAARNGGIEVPAKTIEEAVSYVRRCFNERDGGFAYQPGKSSGFARSAAAIYSLQVCGEYEDPRVIRGSKYLFDAFRPGERFFTYGNFYAAPAQYMIGGKTWADWYGKMKALYARTARKLENGEVYWDMELDRGGGVGPGFVTAVHTMVLAMPYHYLPLYQR